MNKDEIKGSAERVGGKIKEQVGKITDKPDLEQKGHAEQVKGQTRNEVGKIKDALKEASE